MKFEKKTQLFQILKFLLLSVALPPNTIFLFFFFSKFKIWIKLKTFFYMYAFDKIYLSQRKAVKCNNSFWTQRNSSLDIQNPTMVVNYLRYFVSNKFLLNVRKNSTCKNMFFFIRCYYFLAVILYKTAQICVDAVCHCIGKIVRCL